MDHLIYPEPLGTNERSFFRIFCISESSYDLVSTKLMGKLRGNKIYFIYAGNSHHDIRFFNVRFTQNIGTGTISMNSYDIEIFGCALHPLHGNLDNGNIEVFFAQPFGELKTDFTGTDNNYFHQSPLSQQDHFHGVIVHTHLHGTDICT